MDDSNHVYALTLLIRDAPGVLIRCVQVIERRGHAVSEARITHTTSSTRVYIMATGNPATIPQIILQLQKLIDVIAVKKGRTK